LQVIRCVVGENELTALEFQKHYRLPMIHVLDVNWEVGRQYHANSWPFLMLVDANGKVVHAATGTLARQEKVLDRLIQGLLGESGDVMAVERDGVQYAPGTLARSGETQLTKRCDRFPSVACGPGGCVYVVFTSNRHGNSDVFIRIFDGSRWSADRAIAGTKADEFDGVVLVDQSNRVWVSWTSDGGGEKYNIYLTSLDDLSMPQEPMQITHAEDDAMHGRLACDRSGGIWVTYYKWHKMHGISRDKEVYARRYDGTRWSDEIHVSPSDVSQYEDHTDPAIVPYDGGVAVCWSWDFHPPRGYTGSARAPTIFLRTIDEDLNLGRMTTVSGRGIDTTPAIAVDRQRAIWCAWDSLVRDSSSGSTSKGLYVRAAELKRPDRGALGDDLSDRSKNVCTPCFAANSTRELTLVWSEADLQDRWTLKSAAYAHETKRWTPPRTVVAEGCPRFPASAFANDGRLWIAYSTETETGREIRVIAQDLRTLAQSEAVRQSED